MRSDCSGAARISADNGIREIEAMDTEEKWQFFDELLAPCIRCYACREVCPMCFCRDICIMQTQVPHWAGGEVNARESEMRP